MNRHTLCFSLSCSSRSHSLSFLLQLSVWQFFSHTHTHTRVHSVGSKNSETPTARTRFSWVLPDRCGCIRQTTGQLQAPHRASHSQHKSWNSWICCSLFRRSLCISHKQMQISNPNDDIKHNLSNVFNVPCHQRCPPDSHLGNLAGRYSSSSTYCGSQLC